MGSSDERRDTEHLHADAQVTAWAASGAMALTGHPGSAPVGPPSGLVPRLATVGETLRSRAALLDAEVDVDPLALLGERAALTGLEPRGNISCGGATRLLRARGGWFAVSLARPEDVDLVPAWLELDEAGDNIWSTVAEAAAERPVDDVVDRALLVGLPVALLPRLGEAGPSSAAASEGLPVERLSIPGTAPPAARLADVVVVDLSGLWAGPLCGALLALGGAAVIKVESLSRPDGARLGPPAFFDLMNAGKRGVALDLRDREGVALLRRLLSRADVVIEASRPRALEQMGIEATELLASGNPRVWASVTGHGRCGAGRDRVAFGDDAAVAGGLVCWTEGRPVFCADAAADPAAGLVAAAAIVDALASGGRWLLDVSMAAVAAHLAGRTLPVPAWVGPASAPRARAAAGRGPRLGEHTDAVLGDLGL